MRSLQKPPVLPRVSLWALSPTPVRQSTRSTAVNLLSGFHSMLSADSLTALPPPCRPHTFVLLSPPWPLCLCPRLGSPALHSWLGTGCLFCQESPPARDQHIPQTASGCAPQAVLITLRFQFLPCLILSLLLQQDGLLTFLILLAVCVLNNRSAPRGVAPQYPSTRLP